MDHEVCPGVVDIPNITLLEKTDFLSYEVELTFHLLTFPLVARH